MVEISENDVTSIKEALVRIEQSLTEFRVLVAGNYVPKVDFNDHLKTEEARVVALHKKIDDHQKEERADRWKMIGAVLAASSFVSGLIQWIKK